MILPHLQVNAFRNVNVFEPNVLACKQKISIAKCTLRNHVMCQLALMFLLMNLLCFRNEEDLQRNAPDPQSQMKTTAL